MMWSGKGRHTERRGRDADSGREKAKWIKIGESEWVGGWKKKEGKKSRERRKNKKEN